jgi:hypothetical protein
VWNDVGSNLEEVTEITKTVSLTPPTPMLTLSPATITTTPATPSSPLTLWEPPAKTPLTAGSTYASGATPALPGPLSFKVKDNDASRVVLGAAEVEQLPPPLFDGDR